jgi:UDP-GlcNAc:undecaprenyl-phosphate GlcNAc-1-phosphate transferase
LIILRYKHVHENLTADHDLKGVQKFHEFVVPRVGGIGIFVGIICSLLYEYQIDAELNTFGLMLIVAAIPAFVAGLAEDVTKRVSIKKRMIATIISAGLGGYLLDGWITRMDVIGLDYILGFGVISFAFTCLAVAGVSNAFNIIDGYNGLSAMVAIIILSGLNVVAGYVGDYQVSSIIYCVIGSILGFLIWNYPKGLIFLGDGGAYLIGFMVAELSVLLVARNPTISAWFPLLLIFYPIFETLFTIFRRIVLFKKSPGLPDAAHLHQLIYKRVVRWVNGADSFGKKTQRNSMTSPYLWVMTMLAVIPAILFWNDGLLLQICVLIYSLLYIAIYSAMYKSRSMGWLYMMKKNARSQKSKK